MDATPETPAEPLATASHAAATYLYLRVAIILMIVLLAGAVIAWDRSPQNDVPLGSISASWYTPVQSIFVGVLVAVGAAMIAIRGRGLQEPLLNFAGLFAPVVAFVPTHDPASLRCFGQEAGTLAGQQPPSPTEPGWDAAACTEWVLRAEFTVTCYLAIATIGLVLATIYIWTRPRAAASPKRSTLWSWFRERVLDASDREPTRNEELAGAGLAWAVWIGWIVWFTTEHAGPVPDNSFLLNAHDAAAVLVFAPMAVVALLSGLGSIGGLTGVRRHAEGESTPDPRRVAVSAAYVAVFLVILVGLVATGGARLLGWVEEDSRWFWNLEFVLLLGFLAFWVVQTWEERGAEREAATQSTGTTPAARR
ncbi:hypothetical protein [Antribacter gilvus]|uniref:hypothetical protein n=1 Tax=Antribacter gilvus TaxID=2304675 RepID=UPI000F77BD2E|nr:hypothetical protein [Antribacter gilvus]